MTQVIATEPKMEFRMVGIELLNSSLSLPLNINIVETKFNFNINLESKIDNQQKLIFVVASIEIKTEDLQTLLGNITVSCIYEVANFDEVVKVKEDNKIELSQQPLDVLNSITISTTRGIMFSTFKGTFLHNALLPIVDPKAFVPTPLPQ